MPRARVYIFSVLSIGVMGLGISLFGQAVAHKPKDASAPQIISRPIVGQSLDETFAPLPQTAFAQKAILTSPADLTPKQNADVQSPRYPIASSTGISITPAPAFEYADKASVENIIALYRVGDVVKADASAKALTSPISKTAVEWAALRFAPKKISFDRLTQFLKTNPDWPAHQMLRKRAEDMLFNDPSLKQKSEAYFNAYAPVSPAGQLAQARLFLTQGRTEEAKGLIVALWRDCQELPASVDQIVSEFGALLTPADHKWRADRLFYKDQQVQATKIASLAGANMNLLQQARMSVLNKVNIPLDSLPTAFQNDPSLVFARIKILISDEKWTQAASLIASIPSDPKILVDADEWWTLRRTLARKMLDMNNAAEAYRLSADYAATSLDNRLEAEFQAGWIALRFLKDTQRSTKHFARLASISSTPMSISRAAYWQGRAADAAGDHAGADNYWHLAAQQTGTYYGQLARSLLGQNDLPIRKPDSIATGDARFTATRVVEMLEASGLNELTLPLVVEAARNWTDLSQLSAMAGVLMRANDAHATLVLGKYAGQRGLQLDEAAWPVFGIPVYQPLANSAPNSIVYAIARQESSFEHKAKSTAGAKGLMQMISATAKRTAERAGIAFEEQRLVEDPSFNAQLGAAHLGDLINDNRGSLLLSFAAYNAGARRVKEWITAYGDPRDSAVDPIDWVERIPFSETRNYVQRVTENLAVYRARFGENNPIRVVEDLRGRPRL